VILDEIGRGTATFDGLSIAWATIEHLHDVNRCRALFATHFHELTALAGRLERLHNATVRVKEWQGEVVFLHEVTAGAADRSYGIHVAQIAGLPARVIERAKLVLAMLEAEDRSGPKGFEDLPLFAAPPRPSQRTPDAAYELMLAAVAALNPDDMSPREAMEALYALKEKLAQTE
jgi:DNA mismatch repair protein MutS